MRVGDLVYWSDAGLIANALGHPQTCVSGIVVDVMTDHIAVALTHGRVEYFSPDVLEVISEGR